MMFLFQEILEQLVHLTHLFVLYQLLALVMFKMDHFWFSFLFFFFLFLSFSFLLLYWILMLILLEWWLDLYLGSKNNNQHYHTFFLSDWCITIWSFHMVYPYSSKNPCIFFFFSFSFLSFFFLNLFFFSFLSFLP